LSLKNKNFFQKYPKQGSSACWNSVQDKRFVKNKKEKIKKGTSKAPESEMKKKEKKNSKKKIGVIGSNNDDSQIKRKVI